MHQKISFFFSLSCVSGTIFSWEKSKVLPQTTSPLPNLNWAIQALNHPSQRTKPSTLEFLKGRQNNFTLVVLVELHLKKKMKFARIFNLTHGAKRHKAGSRNWRDLNVSNISRIDWLTHIPRPICTNIIFQLNFSKHLKVLKRCFFLLNASTIWPMQGGRAV